MTGGRMDHHGNSIAPSGDDPLSVPNRFARLCERIDSGLALIESDGFRMPELTLAPRLHSPGYGRLLELVALGDEPGVDLATRRFTLQVHHGAEAAARRRAYDLAISLLVDTAVHLRGPATIVLDRGTGAGIRPGGLHLSIDRFTDGVVVATIVTDFADVVPRENLNSALLSLASWFTIETAAPHKPIFRKTWPNPDTAGGVRVRPGEGDASAIAAAISLAVVQVLDAVGEAPVVLRHSLAQHPLVNRLLAPLFQRLDADADQSIARDVVRIPMRLWKVPPPAEVDPRVETEAVRAIVAHAEQQASDVDDELSLMALDDILKHLDERRAYESELIDWLQTMATQRDALVRLTTLNRRQEENNR